MLREIHSQPFTSIEKNGFQCSGSNAPRYFEEIEVTLIFLTLFTANSGKNRLGKVWPFSVGSVKHMPLELPTESA